MKADEQEKILTIKHIKISKFQQYSSHIILALICIIILLFILLIGTLVQHIYIEQNKVESTGIGKSEQKLIEQKKLEEELKQKEEELRKKDEEEKQRLIEEEQKLKKFPVLTQGGIDRMKNIYNSDTKRVFLTFDDGPSANTSAILDILKQNQINATFFVLGSCVQSNPELVKRAWDEGNYIASHGMSHSYKTLYSNIQNVMDEYNLSINIINEALGTSEYNPHLFRFPGGKNGRPYNNIKQEAASYLEEQGIFNVDWSALSGDAEGNNFSVEHLLERTKQTVGDKKNIVFLMHDAIAKTTTVEALQQIIDYFRDNGYIFLTFYDIFDTQYDLKYNPELEQIN